ncbi:hypothetical protein GCM10023170_011330 [Phytohabitans houttuyneae]|uniref:Uncharacterized protein n=1 Tax=Phytohabitans houttuyneae TaxID=1076126 RepID=A0A6V8KFL5_9ACTN|nr:hypothetical protein Phou_037050 [Phytohabitans houttuyneae]
MWGSTPYGGDVGTDRHRTPRFNVSVDQELWDAYGDVVGDGGRSDDLREYMTWRVEHPDEPLPGRFRGPVKKVRARRTGDE